MLHQFITLLVGLARRLFHTPTHPITQWYNEKAEYDHKRRTRTTGDPSECWDAMWQRIRDSHPPSLDKASAEYQKELYEDTIAMHGAFDSGESFGYPSQREMAGEFAGEMIDTDAPSLDKASAEYCADLWSDTDPDDEAYGRECARQADLHYFDMVMGVTMHGDVEDTDHYTYVFMGDGDITRLDDPCDITHHEDAIPDDTIVMSMGDDGRYIITFIGVSITYNSGMSILSRT